MAVQVHLPKVPSQGAGIPSSTSSKSAAPKTSRYAAFTREARGVLKSLRPSAGAINIAGLFSWSARGGGGPTKFKPTRDMFSEVNAPPYEHKLNAANHLSPPLSRQKKREAAKATKAEAEGKSAASETPVADAPALTPASRKVIPAGRKARSRSSMKARKADGKPNRVLNFLSDQACNRVHKRKTGAANRQSALPGMPGLSRTFNRASEQAAAGGPVTQSPAGGPLPVFEPVVMEPLPDMEVQPEPIRGAYKDQVNEYAQLRSFIQQKFGVWGTQEEAVDDLHRDLLMLSSLEEGQQCAECQAIVLKLELASGGNIQLARRILRELGTTYDIARNPASQAGEVHDATWHAALMFSRDAVGLRLLRRLAICQSSPGEGARAGDLPPRLAGLHAAWYRHIEARSAFEQCMVDVMARQPDISDAALQADPAIVAAKRVCDEAAASWATASREWRAQELRFADCYGAYRNFLEASDTVCVKRNLTMSELLANPWQAAQDAGEQNTAMRLAHRVVIASRQALAHYDPQSLPGPAPANRPRTLEEALGDNQVIFDYFTWNQGYRDNGPESEFMELIKLLVKFDKYAERAVKELNGETSAYDPRKHIGMKKSPVAAMGGESYSFQSALAQTDRANYDKSLLALAEHKKNLILEQEAYKPEELAEYATQLAMIALYQEGQATMDAAYAVGQDGTTRPLMQVLDTASVCKLATDNLHMLGRKHVLATNPDLSADIAKDKRRLTRTITRQFDTFCEQLNLDDAARGRVHELASRIPELLDTLGTGRMNVDQEMAEFSEALIGCLTAEMNPKRRADRAQIRLIKEQVRSIIPNIHRRVEAKLDVHHDAIMDRLTKTAGFRDAINTAHAQFSANKNKTVFGGQKTVPKLSSELLQQWLPALAVKAKEADRPVNSLPPANEAGEPDYATDVLVKHFKTLQWLESEGEFRSLATKDKIYDAMIRAVETQRNNSFTGTSGAEIGIDAAVSIPIIPGAVSVRPRVGITCTRTASVSQARNLNGVTTTIMSGRGKIVEGGADAVFGADAGVVGVGAFFGLSGGVGKNNGKGVTVRFKTEITESAEQGNSVFKVEQATDPFLRDAEGNPVNLDASRVEKRKFLEFMKTFGAGPTGTEPAVRQETDQQKLERFMYGFSRAFLEVRNLELTGAESSSRSVQVTGRAMVGARVGAEDVRAFAGVGIEGQVRGQTRTLVETSQRAAANNGTAELHGKVGVMAGVNMTPGSSSKNVKLSGLNALSVQATLSEASIGVEIKQQMKDGELDEYCTFRVVTTRDVAALRSVLAPDIDQWRDYSGGEHHLKQFLDEYDIKNKGDNSHFFLRVENLRKPALVKIRNYDSQINGLEIELSMARSANDPARVKSLEAEIEGIRVNRNNVLHDDSSWKLYSLAARQYIDRGKRTGPRYGAVLQEIKSKAIAKEIEWFSVSLNSRVNEGHRMESRESLSARAEQLGKEKGFTLEQQRMLAKRLTDGFGLAKRVPASVSAPAAAAAA